MASFLTPPWASPAMTATHLSTTSSHPFSVPQNNQPVTRPSLSASVPTSSVFRRGQNTDCNSRVVHRTQRRRCRRCRRCRPPPPKSLHEIRVRAGGGGGMSVTSTGALTGAGSGKAKKRWAEGSAGGRGEQKMSNDEVRTMELQWGGHPRRGGGPLIPARHEHKEKAHPQPVSLVGPSAVAAATAGAEAGGYGTVSVPKKRIDDLRTYRKRAPPPPP